MFYSIIESCSRLDQPNFNIKEGFLESFSNCKRLQVICLINKNGKANKKTDAYVKLFHQVSESFFS